MILNKKENGTKLNKLLLLILVLALICSAIPASAQSVQSGDIIYISDRHNLTEVNADISNASALQNLGGGQWLLNANLINNNTANSFYLNSSDITWLKINSTGTTFWYYLTSGKTEINNTKITSWNTALNAVNTISASPRSAVYASGASSKLNISNSNLSYLGYNAVNMYGVSYVSSSGNQIINNSFLQNNDGIYLSSSSNNNVLTGNTGTSYDGTGIHLSDSSNNTLTSNTGTSYSGNGILLYSASNNNTLTSNTGISASGVGNGIALHSSLNNILTSNTGTSNTGAGIIVYSSLNNILTSNIGTSTSSVGIYVDVSSDYNAFTSNTGTSSSSFGFVIFYSSNNNLTSNTFNTNSSTATVEDIYVSTSTRNNKFINTDFTKPRKIEFYTALTSEFNQSQDGGVSFMNTNVSIGSTTKRSIVNWTQLSIRFTETFTGATQANYAVSGLIPNKNYIVFNDSTLAYSFTSDASGSLPDFTINFTTGERSVQILSDIYLITPTNGTTISEAYPPAAPAVNFVWTNATYPFYNLVIGTDANFNTVVSSTYHSSETATVYLLSGNQYFWKVRTYLDALTPHVWSATSNFNLTPTYTQPANVTGVHGVIYEKKSDGSLLPISDAVVNIRNEVLNWSDSTVVGSNGYYLFDNLTDNTVYTINAKATGYEDSATEYVTTIPATRITKNILLTKCISSFNCGFITQPVTFTVRNLFDVPFPGVTVTVYKGDELTASDTGLTDNSGSVTFFMNKDTRYRVTFVGGGIDGTITYNVFGSQTNYRIVVVSGFPTGGDRSGKIITNLTTTTINATHSSFSLSYNDSIGSTTSIVFYATNLTSGNTCYSNSTSQVVNLNCTVLSTGTYRYGFTAISSIYGTIRQDKIHNFGAGTSANNPLAGKVDATLLHWMSIALLVFVAALFSVKTYHFGAVIVPFMGLTFWYLGWLQISFLLISTALVIGILVYLRSSEHKTGY